MSDGPSSGERWSLGVGIPAEPQYFEGVPVQKLRARGCICIASGERLSGCPIHNPEGAALLRQWAEEAHRERVTDAGRRAFANLLAHWSRAEAAAMVQETGDDLAALEKLAGKMPQSRPVLIEPLTGITIPSGMFAKPATADETAAAILKQFPDATPEEIEAARVDAIHEKAELEEMKAAQNVEPSQNFAEVYRPNFMQRVRNRFFPRRYCAPPTWPEGAKVVDGITTVTSVRLSWRDLLRAILTRRLVFEVKTERAEVGDQEASSSAAVVSVVPWPWLMDQDERAEWAMIAAAQKKADAEKEAARW